MKRYTRRSTSSGRLPSEGVHGRAPVHTFSAGTCRPKERIPAPGLSCFLVANRASNLGLQFGRNRIHVMRGFSVLGALSQYFLLRFAARFKVTVDSHIAAPYHFCHNGLLSVVLAVLRLAHAKHTPGAGELQRLSPSPPAQRRREPFGPPAEFRVKKTSFALSGIHGLTPHSLPCSVSALPLAGMRRGAGALASKTETNSARLCRQVWATATPEQRGAAKLP